MRIDWRNILSLTNSNFCSRVRDCSALRSTGLQEGRAEPQSPESWVWLCPHLQPQCYGDRRRSLEPDGHQPRSRFSERWRRTLTMVSSGLWKYVCMHAVLLLSDFHISFLTFFCTVIPQWYPCQKILITNTFLKKCNWASHGATYL